MHCAPSQVHGEACSVWPNRYGNLAFMMRERAEHPAFRTPTKDPFLEALLSLLAEPNGSSLAAHAYKTTRDWWDEHERGPTGDELLAAMFEPDDWREVIDDPSRPLPERQHQLALIRQWLIVSWARAGAISVVFGHDTVIRPGLSIDLD